MHRHSNNRRYRLNGTKWSSPTWWDAAACRLLAILDVEVPLGEEAVTVMTWVTVTAAQVADPGPDPGAEVLAWEVADAVVDIEVVGAGNDEARTTSYKLIHHGPPQIVLASPPQACVHAVLDVLYAKVLETKHWYAFSNPNQRKPPARARAPHLGIVMSYVANEVWLSARAEPSAMQPLLTQVWLLEGALAVAEAVVDPVDGAVVFDVVAVALARILVADDVPLRIPDNNELTRDVALATIPVPLAVPVLVLLTPVVDMLVVFAFGTVAARIVAL
jgi:hypothetical protein